jgi:hypothetical protein
MVRLLYNKTFEQTIHEYLQKNYVISPCPSGLIIFIGILHYLCNTYRVGIQMSIQLNVSIDYRVKH